MTIYKKQQKKTPRNGTRVREPIHEPTVWRPERSSLTRSEFQQIVMEVIG